MAAIHIRSRSAIPSYPPTSARRIHFTCKISCGERGFASKLTESCSDLAYAHLIHEPRTNKDRRPYVEPAHECDDGDSRWKSTLQYWWNALAPIHANKSPELDDSPGDISADTVAYVAFPVDMLIVACLCTCNTIECLGAQGASEPALSRDVGGGCR